MKLNEESKSAIKEIGNLCVAGGANRIATYSNEVVDISVVESETESTREIILELNPYDDCKLLSSVPIQGDVSGELLVQMSDSTLQDMLLKFSKLPSIAAGNAGNDSILELVTEFAEGFIGGMTGMTELNITRSGNATICKDLDLSKLPEQVLCYRSIIYVGDDRLDFNVYFFADVNVIVPKVLASLGL